MQIEIEVEGMDRLKRRLRTMEKELAGSQGTVYKDIGEIMGDSIDANFNAEGRPKWPPRKGNYSHPILDRTGLMRDTAEMTAREGTWTHSQGDHELKIMSTEYAKYHQYAKPGGLPVRKFVWVLTAEVQKIWDRLRRVFTRG